ncbi:hypothetical protein [Mesorhizobium qingshengii]|uniref:Uncharacterized protein n=1 Tax=Mesorhizobium qingshengii TaxID=1165689 RepID=A0A1G5ZS84_9HYPH|nr:hypothetical protein [Mesorhizobium qingshengii]SDA97681.1 hypothetical protein SAMN02927914_05945 [Mesorhizobium qingshengii]
MITHHVSSTRLAYPNDLALLKKVFDEICKERGFLEGSPEAAWLAARAMHLFQEGIVDEDELDDGLRREYL